MGDYTQIGARLDRLGRFFDLERLARADCSGRGIQRYYRVSRHAYTRFHHRGNAIHMGLSDGDALCDDDFFAQAAFVEVQITPDTSNILELATGRGANALWLARRNPGVQFHGLDLTPAQLAYARRDAANLTNLTLSLGDFHDLQAFAPDSLDLVFVVEALCHSPDPGRVLNQVRRILRPGGRFVVIDGYRTDAPLETSAETDQALRLLARGMAVPDFKHYDEFLKTAHESQMDVVEDQDRSAQIMPSLKRFEALADRFLTGRLKMRVLRAVLPRPLLGNVVSGQSTRRYLRRRAKRIRIEDSQQKGSSICSFSSSPL